MVFGTVMVQTEEAAGGAMAVEYSGPLKLAAYDPAVKLCMVTTKLVSTVMVEYGKLKVGAYRVRLPELDALPLNTRTDTTALVFLGIDADQVVEFEGDVAAASKVPLISAE